MGRTIYASDRIWERFIQGVCRSNECVKYFILGIKNISDKASSGILWTVSQRFAGVGVSFISGIILARLLSPEDYGIIGMLTIFITISSAFLDGGFGAALIQKKEPTQEDYSTIFFWILAE